MGQNGLLSPIDQRETFEGFGAARASGGLNFRGMSCASINARIAELKFAKAAAAAEAKAVKQGRIDNNLVGDAATLPPGSSAMSKFIKEQATLANSMSRDQILDINRTLLGKQITQNKTFLFTSNPKNARAASFSNNEYLHLESKGYTFIDNGGGMYRAVRK